jgi:DNA invertase Pin-like site-specific DNA recombinase
MHFSSHFGGSAESSSGRRGRSLKHLIEVVNELMTRKIGLKSLNDPIDTTTPQGRLTFNLFASLADDAERAIMQSHTAEMAVWPAVS